MGCEYRLVVQEPIPNTDMILRRLPTFESYDKERQTYIYREEGNTGRMPNGIIKIAEDHLYLCDYAMSAQMFGSIIRQLLGYSRSLQIEDYEL